MARVRIPHTFLKPDPANANAYVPAVGAGVEIRRRSDNTLVNVYPTETGGAGSTAAQAVDANGKIAGWVDRGAYRVVATGTGLAGYPIEWDAAPAADAAIDPPWLAAAVLPLGAVMPYAGNGDPAGSSWLVCDGRALPRTGTYAGLFGVLSTTYGVGDGSTTFNIPDLRGRVPLGAGTGTGGLTARTRGQTGGVEGVALTRAEQAALDLYAGAAGEEQYAYGAFDATEFAAGQAVSIHRRAAAAAAHQNMPPYAVLSYIIRAA